MSAPEKEVPGNTIVHRHRFDNVVAVWCADGSVGICGITLAVLPDGVELIGNGTCPHPLDVKLSPARLRAGELVEALRKLVDLAKSQRGALGFDETPVEMDARALLRDLGPAS